MELTSRTITLIRHAKAEEDKGMLPDHLRNLNARGREEAASLAAWLATQGFAPDQILCSPAERTRQTLAALQLNAPVEFPETLYLADVKQLLKLIQALPDAAQHVAIIGHNPGLHELATQLVGRYEVAADEDRLIHKFPTCACAIIEVQDIDWSELTPHSATLKALYFAASLADQNRSV